jgi:hypothetical protein
MKWAGLPRSRVAARARPALIALVGALGTAYYAGVLDRVYPLGTWLFWDLASVWAAVVLFSLASASAGTWVLGRVLRFDALPALETSVLGTTIGVVVFALAMYVAGTLGLYDSTFAALLPVVMTALGARRLRPVMVGLGRDLRAAQGRSLASLAALAFGVLCLGVMYLQLMTPDSLNYDATWVHVTIAQDYAREGRIVPFPADYTRNMPQLASLIYTWAYLIPGLNVPLKWMLVLHLEFGLFCWTLAGVVAVVRWLVDARFLRGAWAAFFLFPIIVVYDSNLGGAADHVLAFFAPALLLGARYFARSFSYRSAVLLGIVAGGAALTKYQALYSIAPLLSVLGYIWLCAVLSHRRSLAVVATVASLRRLALAPLVAGLTLALVVAPHFLKNAVFYRNPTYPFLQRIFVDSTPRVPDGALYVDYVFKDLRWVPGGDILDKLWHAIGLFFTFSFEPHYSFTRNVPAFGSLFTLLLPVLLIVRKRRIWLAAVVASGAVLLWGMTFNVDRNLQGILPFLVCVTAALLVEAWRFGWLARVGLIPLVLLQVVWGWDAFFYSGHERINGAITLIRSGFEGRAKDRYSGYLKAYRDVGKALPRDARVLLHSSHVTLGIDREIVLDWAGFQGLVHYDQVRAPRELYEYYRSLGITHILYTPGERIASSRQEEVVFNALVHRHVKRVGTFGGLQLFKLPEQPPPREQPYRVAVLGLHGYADGLYPIQALNANEYIPPALRNYSAPSRPANTPAAAGIAIEEADAVLLGPGYVSSSHLLGRFAGFVKALQYPGQVAVYLRGGRR